MSDPIWVITQRKHAHKTQLKSDRLNRTRVRSAIHRQHHASLIARLLPPIPLEMKRPRALHFQVRMQNPLPQLHKQMLAVWPDALDGLPRERGGSHRGYPQVRVQHFPAHQELHPGRQLKYRIAFRHGGYCAIGVGVQYFPVVFAYQTVLFKPQKRQFDKQTLRHTPNPPAQPTPHPATDPQCHWLQHRHANQYSRLPRCSRRVG